MKMSAHDKLHVHRGDAGRKVDASVESDPVTTQIIRYALNSAAMQMKLAMIRTSFSPIIYETHDFAVVIYDRHVRLLAQAPTLPAFMGTMGFCIEAAVAAIGGEGRLEPGDVLLYNKPYGTGSHAQDAAVVVPVFMEDGALAGYAASKAHWLDIGASAPYCTNTTDVYQEGVVIPGVKLYRRGKLDDDIHRMVLANCRFRDAVDGDIQAQIASCHVGARELLRVIDRFGYAMFEACVERMLDHGEKIVRDFFRKIPQGTYRATAHMDDNGLDDRPIQFDIAVRVEGTNISVDFSQVPDAQPGPVNCPLPSTISGTRVALAMLAGGANNLPNEGYFRPLEVVTRVGSMFHPVEPQPCYLYGWPLTQAMEAICQAFAAAVPDRVPSGSAADVCGVLFYGVRSDTQEAFFGGSALPVGQGAHAHGDGSTLFVIPLAHSQTASPELQEAKLPILYEKWEFTPNSGGAGEYRGGLGWELHYRLLENTKIIATVDRTKVPSWGQQGGLSGHPNRFEVDFPDNRTQVMRKQTDFSLPAGSRLRIYCGGGGGYGSPTQRTSEAVGRDLLEGVITLEHARQHYPQAV